MYTQIYALSVDLTIASYCDPRFLDARQLHEIKGSIFNLLSFLSPHLHRQNFSASASGLSLELEHLLLNIGEFLTQLCPLVTDLPRAGGGDYFRRLHDPERGCDRHAVLSLDLYGNSHITLSMNLLNDVELHLKKLNSVFYCTSAPKALSFLGEVSDFLKRLRGISPIPSPDIYVLNNPCAQCFVEQLLFPNQGQTLDHMARLASCDHVCRAIEDEPIRGLFENELRRRGLPVGDEVDGAPPPRVRGESNVESLRVLDEYTIFQKVNKKFTELSTLLYWNAGVSDLDTLTDATPSRLAELMRHDERMRVGKERLFPEGPRPEHFCDARTASGVESLFSGSVFNSCGDVIDALKKDCSTTFFQRTNFQNMCRKQNELFVRLSELLRSGRDDLGAENDMGEGEGGEAIEAGVRDARVRADAAARRDNYLKKVTREGMSKLKACLEAHEVAIADLLSLRVWGSLVYDTLATLINHFLSRSSMTSRLWVDRTEMNHSTYENSKFMKSMLYQQKLSPEHLDSLTLQFYSLITGPLNRSLDSFPLPKNVMLSCCLDTAGVLPHHKLALTDLIWPTMTARDWIDIRYNNFFHLKCGELNSIQREVWVYVREAVLSVALYNITWEKKLHLRTPGEELSSDGLNGLYLTYEESAPLILCIGDQGWIFRDLYAALYHHLQSSRCGEEGGIQRSSS